MVDTHASGRRIAQHFLLTDAPSFDVQPLRHSAVNVTRLQSDDHDHGTTTQIAPEDAFMLLLQRKQLASHRYWADGREIPVTPFAKGGMCITHLQRNPRKYFGSPFDMLVFFIPKAALNEMAEDHEALAIETLQCPDGVIDPVVGQLAETLLPIFGTRGNDDTLFADYVVLALQTHLARTYGGMQRGTQMARGGLAPWQVRRAKELLTVNLEAGISLSAIAQECELSTSHFARAFKRTVGEPPHRWLTAYRVDHAKNLLLTSDLSLIDIALACGFSDQSYLTRVFTQTVGRSPGAWRRARQ